MRGDCICSLIIKEKELDNIIRHYITKSIIYLKSTKKAFPLLLCSTAMGIVLLPPHIVPLPLLKIYNKSTIRKQNISVIINTLAKEQREIYYMRREGRF